MFRKLRSALVRGLFVVLPIGFTVWLLWWIGSTMETLLQRLILLVVPAHGSAIFVFVTHMILRNAIGHCGVELMPCGVLRWLRWQPITAVTHHDLHTRSCAGTTASISHGGDRPWGIA